MDNSLSEEKPRLVHAGQGFSVLNTVEYKGRLLYSKYDPVRTVTATIKNLHVLAGTLIVVCSPCLWYGIEELLSALPQDCMVLAIESEPELFALSKEILNGSTLHITAAQRALITLLPLFKDESYSHSSPQATAGNISDIDSFINTYGGQGTLRRAIRVDFSAGVQFNVPLYQTVCSAAEATIAQFWKNRLTLVKLGRLYARNIMRNISSLATEPLLDERKNSIEKKILVCGAGESLNKTLELLCKDATLRAGFYILAVDATLPILKSYNIVPDGIVALESQIAIQKAYIGCADMKCTLFADIASRPQVSDLFTGRTVWFASRYADAHYLDRLMQQKILTSFIPPLGSVGLAAVYIALTLRHDGTIPIYVTGLDFSFSCGATHAKGAPAQLTRLSSSSRFSPVENYDASFRNGTTGVLSKNNKQVRTDSIMTCYAEMFHALFANSDNIFDAGISGIPLGLKQKYICNVDDSYSEKNYSSNGNTQFSVMTSSYNFAAKNALNESARKNILQFYQAECHSLELLRNLLQKGDASEYRDALLTLNEQLTLILKECDYLYLHFPDGYKLSCDVHFLKRVRAEIDFFIKDIHFAMQRMGC